MLGKSVVAILFFALFISAAGHEEDQRAIIAVLNQSAIDWNRGDLTAFAHSYKNGPDAEMVGPHNVYGFQTILQRYREHYPNRAAQGTLSFSDLEVRRLDDQFSTVTGHFHLIRSADGGGNQNGYFLLVVEKTPAGWKIVRDATSSLPAPSTGK
jgi:ketosteroid isomerase-like protein